MQREILTKEKLCYDLTGTENPKQLSERESLMIDKFLSIYNDSKPAAPVKEQDSMGYTPKVELWEKDSVLYIQFEDGTGILAETVNDITGKDHAKKIMECWNGFDKLKEEVKRLSDINRELIDLIDLMNKRIAHDWQWKEEDYQQWKNNSEKVIKKLIQ